MTRRSSYVEEEKESYQEEEDEDKEGYKVEEEKEKEGYEEERRRATQAQRRSIIQWAEWCFTLSKRILCTVPSAQFTVLCTVEK